MVRKYPKIYRVGHKEVAELKSNPEAKIYIQEKIDGANFRFWIENGKLKLGSRNRELTEEDLEKKPWSAIYAYLMDRFQNVPDNTLIDPDNGDVWIGDNFIFFGEFCIKHSINYDFDNMPLFLGFDIWIKNAEKFYDWDTAQMFFKGINIETVPTLGWRYAKDIGDYKEDDIPMSEFYPGKAEGIVLKNYNEQIFAKYITESFQEYRKLNFGSSKKFETEDHEKFVAQFITNARIEKQIYKLINEEDMDLDMPMMKYLPRRVLTDANY
jgi:ATP-dependent RNA circularization protein (DNA/RNA ligase family)